MQHARDVSVTTDPTTPNREEAAKVRILPGPPARDRTAPAWLMPLSVLFTLASEGCAAAIAILPIFFHSLVAVGGETLLAPLLLFLAVVPLVGILVFDFGYARAFGGFKQARTRPAAIVRAALAVVVALALTAMHPILAGPFTLAALMGLLLSWGANRLVAREPGWDTLPQEAVSVLAGRDATGWRLATTTPGRSTIADSAGRVTALFALASGFATASWLTATGVMNGAAVASAGLLCYWAARAFSGFFDQLFAPSDEQATSAISVAELPLAQDQGESDGLTIARLSAFDRDGRAVLSDVNLDIAPGQIVGLTGGNFAGKSLLLRAIAAPFDLTDLDVRGAVTIGGQSPWQRSGRDRQVPAVLIPPSPLWLPGTAADNLCCFGDDLDLQQAMQALKQLVYTTDTVDRVSAGTAVAMLSTSEQKALSLARGFYLRPRVYLMDRPEDGATPALTAALARRIQQECRMGAIFLIASDNREIMDLCDQVVVMQGGRIIDVGTAEDIRTQKDIGWRRLRAARSLESEEALDSWLRSQFRRDGDDGNRRNVCVIASELLAFSCQDLAPGETGGKVTFEFKHFESYCMVRMLDSGQPVSSGYLEKMQSQAEQGDGVQRLAPLAAVMRDALSVEARRERQDSTTEDDGEAAHRVIEVKIATYDPRKPRSQGEQAG